MPILPVPEDLGPEADLGQHHAPAGHDVQPGRTARMSLLCLHGNARDLCSRCQPTQAGSDLRAYEASAKIAEVEQLDGELLKIKKPEPGRCFCNNVGAVYIETGPEMLESVACPFCVARGLSGTDAQALKDLGQKVARVSQADPGERKVSFEED